MNFRIYISLIIILAIFSNCSTEELPSYNNSVSEADSLSVFTNIDSANVYRIKGDLEAAKSYVNDALENAKQLNWGKGLASSYTNLAYINLYESDFEAAMENAVEGLRIAEICIDLEDQGLANLIIGFIYFNLGDTNLTIPYYEKSLSIRLELGNDYDIGYSYSYFGNFYMAQKQADSALYYHKKALEHRLKTDDTRSIADSYLLIGATLLKEKKFDESLEYLQKAILKYAQISDKKRLAETYRNFAEVYLIKGNLDDAQNFLLQADQLAKETGSKDNQIKISEQLAAINYTNENYKEAYDYLRFHTTTFKETSGESKYRDIVKNILEYKNEKERKIKQLEFDQKEERQEISYCCYNCGYSHYRSF